MQYIVLVEEKMKEKNKGEALHTVTQADHYISFFQLWMQCVQAQLVITQTPTTITR